MDMDPIEKAQRGNTDYFKDVELEVIQKSRDKFGNAVLSIAAMKGHLGCCKVIYRRCPELLYHTSNNGVNALHNATYNSEEKVAEFLITARATLEQEDKNAESGEDKVDYRLLMMTATFSAQTALHSSVIACHLPSVKLLTEADLSKKLLGMIDQNKETAMHIAVRSHQIEIVKVLFEADPSFEYSVNTTGHTPLFIAFDEAFSGNHQAVEIRNFLLQRHSSHCTIRTGRSQWTLLHHVTSKGDLSAIEEIIRFNPDFSELVDGEGRNFLHVATKFNHEHVVKYILGLENISYNVLNGQDMNGDTPLHVATANTSVGIALCLLYDHRLSKLIQNKQGKNALDAIKFDYDKRKAGVVGLTDSVDEKELKERSDFDLLVGALISTVSFTAGITVPGGYITDGPNKGIAILYKKRSFEAFVVSNTIALALSLFAVFSHFCMKRLVNEKDITYQLKVATFCSIGAIFAMMTAFIAGSYTVLSISDELALVVCVICCCFFVFAFHSMWRMRKKRQQRPPSVHEHSPVELQSIVIA